MAFKDRARFYDIHGRQFPSVTTVLQVIAKGEALNQWFAKMERQAFETAMLEVATRHATISGEFLLDTVLDAVHGVKAADKARDSAANIGTQAHAMIEWLTRRMLGLDVDAEPVIADAAMIAVEAWKDWAKAVEFTPLHVEPVVYYEQYGYAGRCDVIAMIEDVKTLADYKSSKAVYAEAFLQVGAYRHAGASIGLDSDAGLILRLPKTLADPTFEAVPVPDQPLDVFLSALCLWRWQRAMNNQPVGG